MKRRKVGRGEKEVWVWGLKFNPKQMRLKMDAFNLNRSQVDVQLRF